MRLEPAGCLDPWGTPSSSATLLKIAIPLAFAIEPALPGPLPLAYCQDAIVYHRVGTAIGSLLKRFRPRSLLTAHVYSLAKAAQLLAGGYAEEAKTILVASFGRAPTAAIRQKLSAEAVRAAFPDQ